MSHRRLVRVAALASSLVLASAVSVGACAEDAITPGPKPDSGATAFDAGGGGDSSTADTGAGRDAAGGD